MGDDTKITGDPNVDRYLMKIARFHAFYGVSADQLRAAASANADAAGPAEIDTTLLRDATLGAVLALANPARWTLVTDDAERRTSTVIASDFPDPISLLGFDHGGWIMSLPHDPRKGPDVWDTFDVDSVEDVEQVINDLITERARRDRMKLRPTADELCKAADWEGFEGWRRHIACKAIAQATKRVTTWPFFNGELHLSAIVQFSGPDMGGPTWVGNPDVRGLLPEGQDDLRAIVLVKALGSRAGAGYTVDAFYTDIASREIRPVNPSPPIWWGADADSDYDGEG